MMHAAARTMLMAGLVAGTVLSSRTLADEMPGLLLEVRRAQREPAEGLTKAEVPGRSGQVIYLHPKTELTNADVAEATVGQTEQGAVSVNLTLTDAGAKKLGEISASHLFRPLAFLINGQVVCAPVVAGKISRQAQIVGDFSEAEAEHIANGIVGRVAP